VNVDQAAPPSTNNIKISNSNDQNITITYRIARVILSVLNFGHWSLFEICFLMLEILMILISD